MVALRHPVSKESKKGAAKREILRRPHKDDFHEQREHDQKQLGILRHGSAGTEPTRGRVPQVLRKIAVATDFGPSSRRAVDLAIELSVRLRTELVVVHCVEPFAPDPGKLDAAARKALDGEVKRVRRSVPSAHKKLLRGGAGERIAEFVHEHDVDLLVLGMRERGPSRSSPSDVVEEVARSSCAAVLTVRC